MGCYPAKLFHSTFNLFKDEKASSENLKVLLKTPVGYNSSEEIDPMHPFFNEIRGVNIFPTWVYEFYNGYKCIEKLIILAQRNRYLKSEKDEKYKLV